MARLTAKFIEENVRRPDKEQVIIRDDELPGFGIRATKGSMSWVVEGRVDGKLRRQTIGKYQLMSVDDARNTARKVLSGWARRRLNQPVPTLGEVLEQYVGMRKFTKNTLRNYRNLTKRCLGDWFELPMTDITKAMIRERHQELTKTTKQGTSGKTQANVAMSNLNTLFRFAMHHYETSDGQPVVVMNPVVTLSHNRAWHSPVIRRVIIPDSKLRDWYRAVLSLRQKMVRDYLLVLILTGMRRTEAATLEWRDIDFESRTITVRSENTKNKNEYSLPMTDFIIDIMRRRKEDPRRSEFVFPGRSLDTHMVDNGHSIENVVERSGCQWVPHDLRRYSEFRTMPNKSSVETKTCPACGTRFDSLQNCSA